MVSDTLGCGKNKEKRKSITFDELEIPLTLHMDIGYLYHYHPNSVLYLSVSQTLMLMGSEFSDQSEVVDIFKSAMKKASFVRLLLCSLLRSLWK